MAAHAARAPTSRIVATPMVMAFLGTCCSPKKSLAASTRVTLSRYTARVRVSLADLQEVELSLSALPGWAYAFQCSAYGSLCHALHDCCESVSCSEWQRGAHGQS